MEGIQQDDEGGGKEGDGREGKPRLRELEKKEREVKELYFMCKLTPQLLLEV